MSDRKPSRFQLNADEFLRVVTGHLGVIGSPLPDSVPSPRVTEASSGPGATPPQPLAGAAVVSFEDYEDIIRCRVPFGDRA